MSIQSTTSLAEIPTWIMNSRNLEMYKAILRGIFDTDGSFFCKKAYGRYDKQWTKEHHCKPKIQIKLISGKLVKQICELLTTLKIEYKTGYRKREIKSNRNNSPVYIINIYKLEYIKKWFLMIKTNNPRHQTRYSVWKN